MAYEPKTWSCGETITADALNHIEQGIAESGGGSMVVTVTEESIPCEADGTKYRTTYSHSWQEIHDAFRAGRPVTIEYSNVLSAVVCVIPLSTTEGRQNPYMVSAYDYRERKIVNLEFEDDPNKKVFETQCFV